MLRLILIVGICGLFLLPPENPASADEDIGHIANGSELLTYCARIRSKLAQTACLGYIAGISDAMIEDQVIGKGAVVKACIPRSDRAGTRAAKVIPWLTKRTERLSEPAARLVAEALSEAYPCK